MGGFPGPPNSDGVAEIAYGIAPVYQGKGYATEVANALIDFASRDSPGENHSRAHTRRNECFNPRAGEMRIEKSQRGDRSGK